MEMTLREFMLCSEAFQEKRRIDSNDCLYHAWLTGAFTGAAFSGKLRAFDTYCTEPPASSKSANKQNSKDEFERQLAKATQKEGKANGN
jgi:hypothetical protein